ncbi:2-phosphosulfolactate phosphatase [Streptomyces sp. NPDC048717]|uniref:2-phosphosulfolactate phosphatase n=1 Tax=Streptomyces sp. NPDC048717 TaxID=3154928 RepID=UPI003425CA8B
MTVSFGWGPAGARALAAPDADRADGAACVVVVDVLSFTTAVGVAVEAGTAVYPYRWRDESAAAYAREKDAVLAVGRRAATPEHPYSLSPAALRAAPAPARLVLPSPNGSTISAEAAAGGATVIAASLRNAGAVARRLAAHGHDGAQRPLTIVAAGERWPDGSLRPALEDLLGAGAVLAALRAERPDLTLTPEATAAATLWTATKDPVAALHGCESGRELYAYGCARDVEVAAETDASAVVPVLVDGAFQEAP